MNTTVGWFCIFGNSRPVCVEIGPGRGEFLIATARHDTERNYYAIERSRSRARVLERRLNALGLANVRLLNADARCALRFVEDASVHKYYLQFPDPWWKRRHERRRLMTPAFVGQVARTLCRNGTIELITDVSEYFRHAQELLDAHPLLDPVNRGPVAHPCTSFGRKARQRGLTVWASVHRRL